jgi:MFS family permease
VLARLVDGVGDSFVHTACFSIISIVFSDEKEKYIGRAESVIGFGLMIGPVLGSFVYAAFGYMHTFFFFVILEVMAVAALALLVPNRLNYNSKRVKKQEIKDSFIFKSQEDSQSEDLEVSRVSGGSTESVEEIFYWMFFNNSRSIFALITCTMVVIFIDFYEAILSVHLLQVYELGSMYNGYVFAVPCLTYCIATPLVSEISERFPSKRVFILLSLALTVVSLFLAGPSPLLGFDQSFILLVSGLALIGVSAGFAFIPIFPEIMESVMEKEGLEEETDELCDKVSGIYGTFYSFGSVLAPIIGGALGDEIGYRRTCDVVAIATLIFCIFFFVFNAKEEINGCKSKKSQKEVKQVLINYEDDIKVLDSIGFVAKKREEM